MSEETQQIAEPSGDVVVYEAPDGAARVEVVVREDTVWLTEGQMAGLFARERSVINRHIRNVFAEGELSRGGSVRILHTTPEGGRPGAAYSLDVVISVGYRVKSKRGTYSAGAPPARGCPVGSSPGPWT
jgi:hypothetical protein